MFFFRLPRRGAIKILRVRLQVVGETRSLFIRDPHKGENERTCTFVMTHFAGRHKRTKNRDVVAIDEKITEKQDENSRQNKMTVHTQRSTFHKKLEEAHHSGWRNFSHPGREHHHSAKGTKCGSLARGFQKFSLFLNEKPPMSYSSLGGKNKIIFITSLTK
jgi:hypothetical protein